MAEEQQNGPLSTYVVQVMTESGLWKDMQPMKVPPRTKRSTILRNALAGDVPTAGVYRVLDAESSDSFDVTLEEQPPRLVID